jgi:hypothetical protein
MTPGLIGILLSADISGVVLICAIAREACEIAFVPLAQFEARGFH